MNIFNSFWNPAIIWFVAGLVLLLLEIAAPGLVLFFFGIGAWSVAILILVFNIGLDLQLFIFFISSLLLLVSLRRWVQKLFRGRVDSSAGENASLIGEKGVITEPIIPPRNGKIEVHGTNWSAEAEVEIPQGALVEIIAQKNLTLKVKSLN